MFDNLQISQAIQSLSGGSAAHPKCKTQCPEECNKESGGEWITSGTPPGYDTTKEEPRNWHEWNKDESFNVKCGKMLIQKKPKVISLKIALET